MKKLVELYSGKAKTIYSTKDPNLLILKFRNDTSALDGQRIEQLDRKGMINNKFSYYIMTKLAAAGIPTHIKYILYDNELLVKKLEMIPIEFIIRNYAAGSLIKRLGIEEGMALNPPLFELYLKNDKMQDPIINESYCLTFGWINKKHLVQIKTLTYKTNNVLSKLFDNAGLILVDFKLEFGLLNGKVVLGDEFSPDNSRLWDKYSMNKMDKDRFRLNLGGVIDAYEEVAKRIGIDLLNN